ncbi:hypothetical protein VSX60_21080 [Aurantimonas sp. A3-2-R12]|nr:hypothetical protein [Aurantimonas sp. A3-2-R12]
MSDLCLTEAEYVWVTDKLLGVARTHGEGRVLSMLEGGYEPGALARSVVAHLKALIGGARRVVPVSAILIAYSISRARRRSASDGLIGIKVSPLRFITLWQLAARFRPDRRRLIDATPATLYGRRAISEAIHKGSFTPLRV